MNETTLEPAVAPNPAPVIVTEAPTGPAVGLTLAMLGGSTAKLTPLPETPPTVTTTLPVVVVGTIAAMLEGLQLVIDAPFPLNVTVLVPCEAPKFAPAIVTNVPIWPEEGVSEVMTGVGSTLNATELLVAPPTVTKTFPVVAPVGTEVTMLVVLQLVGVAVVPLNVTVLVP